MDPEIVNETATNSPRMEADPLVLYPTTKEINLKFPLTQIQMKPCKILKINVKENIFIIKEKF